MLLIRDCISIASIDSIKRVTLGTHTQETPKRREMMDYVFGTMKYYNIQ